MSRIEVGNKFGKLTVLAKAPSRNYKSCWLCKCDCGIEHYVITNNLTSGHTKSCGCLTVEANKTHGCSSPETAEYFIWKEMRSRCRNPLNKAWEYYGGRGIKVCERWIKFENFLSDMGLKPAPGFTVERINNEGNYEPRNCKWATRKEQSANQRPRRKYRTKSRLEEMEKE